MLLATPESRRSFDQVARDFFCPEFGLNKICWPPYKQFARVRPLIYSACLTYDVASNRN